MTTLPSSSISLLVLLNVSTSWFSNPCPSAEISANSSSTPVFVRDDNTISLRYPAPPLVTSILSILSPSNTTVAAAPIPNPVLSVNVIVVGSQYPAPPLVTSIDVISPLSDTLICNSACVVGRLLKSCTETVPRLA